MLALRKLDWTGWIGTIAQLILLGLDYAVQSILRFSAMKVGVVVVVSGWRLGEY